MPKMRAISLIIAVTTAISCQAALPELRFAWKEVDYVWDSPAQRETAVKDGLFVPANNLPLGLARWKNKVFVTVPRWKNGVASSLNYVDLDGAQDQPLKPYPSLKENLVSDSAKELPSNSSIISVFRVFVDPCDRLWVMDSGLADILGSPNQVAGPSLVIFDLNTNQLIHRYFFKVSDMKEDSFFANIVVDVDKNTCDNAFAYVPDLGGYGVVVYSLKQDDSWRVTHHYFHFEPLAGTYNVGGIEFHWTDGVFALALSEPRENGFRTMFFHAFSSTKEFCVSTELLRNYTHIDKTEAFHDFKLLGDRGERTQSSASYYDTNTSVLFYTQINRNGIGCWNSNKPYTPENNPLLFNDSTLFEFLNDLKVDDEGTLWLLSDKLPRFIYKSLDPNEINYRIFSMKASDAIAGSACE
ncbi:L-dopachrome tautomerase yellow-f2-like [Vanessa atalanta]|uniref:L-dopachrome tautomerase yellow-f2-like n=1 Tax=Vanessa atalanta TaxID=42275 RepID=UPI001FCE29B8|nr:L-dopachrome tautomerase yellow-f2-like [Vanessa atalanta]